MEKDPFFVVEYDVLKKEYGTLTRIVWGCSFCHKEFVCYDRPPLDHKQECLAWILSKI